MATATSKLQVIIDLVTGNSSKNASELEKNVTSLSFSFNQVVQAAGTVKRALEQAWDVVKKGAEIELVAQRFDRLSESIGTTSDALMNDLSAAMGGMLSDAEMMTAATDLMALGLANSHEEVIRLATVAGQLNMNMNQLVLTLTNQTTMRFDALGVSVAGFDEKVKALEATGMSASEAFNEAFLQQAEEQLAKVGSAVDSVAGKVAKMGAAWKNATATVQTWAAEAFSGIYDTVQATDLLRQAYDTFDAEGNRLIDEQQFEDLARLVNEGAISVDVLISYLNDLIAEANSSSDAVGGLSEAYSENINRANDMRNSTSLLMEATEEMSGVMAPTAEDIRMMKGELVLASEAAARAASAERESAAATDAMASAARSAGEALSSYFSLFDQEPEDAAAALEDQMTQAIVDMAVEAANAGQDYAPFLALLAETDPEAAAAAESAIALGEGLNIIKAAVEAGIPIDQLGDDVNNLKDSMTDYLDPGQQAEEIFTSLGLSVPEVATAMEVYDTAVKEGVSPTEAMQLALEAVGIHGGEAATAMYNFRSELALAESPLAAVQTLASQLEDPLKGAAAGADSAYNAIKKLVDEGPYSTTVTITVNYPNGPPPSLDDYNSGGSPPKESFAGGGNVLAGGSYLVGEQGPELFVPYTHGEILTNNEISGMGGSTVNIYQNNDIKNLNPLVAAMNQAYIDSSLVNEFRRQL